MSTIQFTLIEGAIAMPRLRPLDRLPTPFGRDWTLLPPGQSWRTDIKALYAAVLRTFCMSDKAILSFCRWVPLNARRAAAAVASAATATRATTVFHPAREETPHGGAEAGALPMAEAPVLVSRSRDVPPHWKAFAGGACALSGAAILAWIAFDHSAHRQTIAVEKTVVTANANGDVPPAQRRVPEVVIGREAVGGGAVKARASSAASVRAERASSSARSTYAPVSSATQAAPPRVASSDTGSRRHTLRTTASSRREKTRDHLARSTTANPLSRAASMADGMPHITVPPIARRTSPAPSTAGKYSPPAPARLGIDEYADVTMSAATRLRDIAPPPRPAASNHSPLGNGTEWMNHISQRRVTEVPDQFGK
ncbi:hypothetical protein CIC12_08225 [Burkholderia sp. SG-MS1]|uniref:hypothetical protein n=1 Tax=Paraburkholderia sp. SG-MS1 TaxID=2023741 RepID=UPI00144825AC|nr:hypothetical protein [Paraburkholderia sp. SG-MS1]NKJ46728.1 hypothetical protein [Paraburkholderia sp. SG-MS1]